ncbi:putative methyltransferase DDB_G0268948 isoform X1 [Hemitrygon akajei]|uniref:putative methyltransferase DDB_G0268948 isoform X1 n=1 Tax=Hemitrygon akajei TaxID=2704970 RepID=UPI003BF98333
MATRFFEGKEHAALYQKYRPCAPTETNSLILKYLEKKKGKPFSLAVDVGCGSGQSSRGLAPFFDTVVGVDVSEAQIEEAKKTCGLDNVSYRQGVAEKLDFQDASVDLVTAAAAAHWFDVETFVKEVDRVLKPKGCLALHSYQLPFAMHYSNCSEHLTLIVEELFERFEPYKSERTQMSWNKYKGIFEAITFLDKERVDNILIKHQVSISWVMGFIKSLSSYQTFLKKDPEAAKSLLEITEQRLLQAMGVSSNDTVVEITMNYFCLLASKPEKIKKYNRIYKQLYYLVKAAPADTDSLSTTFQIANLLNYFSFSTPSACWCQ